MPTSIGGELRRYRSLTIALIVGIIASVSAFITLLSLDIEEKREDLLVQINLYSLQTEDRLVAAFDAIERQLEFIQLASSLPASRQEIFLSRSANDLDLNQLLDQFCVVDTLSGDEQYRLRNNLGCPADISTAVLIEPIKLGGQLQGVLHLLPVSEDPAGMRLVISVAINSSASALFSLLSTKLLLPQQETSKHSLGDSGYSCLFRSEFAGSLNIACSRPPDGMEGGLGVDELMAASSIAHRHPFSTNGLNWELVTILSGGAVATAVSSFPAIVLILLLIMTGLVCYYFYQATEKNLQLRRRQRELSSALVALEQRNTDLEQFAYMASHDLQTPVRHIIYRSTMLVEDLDAGSHDAVRENAERLILAGDRMQALLLDLLEFCRAGNSANTLAMVNTREIVERQVEMIRDTEDSMTIDLQLGTLPSIETDEVKLEQILQNLLANAVRFRRRGVTPRLFVGAEWDAANNVWTFRVSDNGIGINTDNLERIFLPFKQLDLERAAGGTGVGLSIARRLTGRLGGKIWATSEAGKGTTFFFTLPAVYNGTGKTRLSI